MQTQPRPDHCGAPRRTAALSVTATTLVALLAMSATVSAAPAPAGPQVEARLQSTVARAVAAVVAAAARDFLGTKQSTAAVALLEPLTAVTGSEASWPASWPTLPAGPPMLLGERLLDLPPPTC
ncbi:MAG: hypothetical protein ACYTE6_08045 [Planctomycetota bacterium]|jgi:hypothetical protein